MEHILVVSDDLQGCKSLIQVLIKAGYQVDYTCNVGGTFQHQQTLSADLLIFEMCLSGSDALQTISNICDRFATPILISSESYDEQAMLNGLQAGADQYLAKPYTNNELLARIKVLLRRVLIEKQRHTLQYCSQSFSLKIARLALTETEMLLLQYLSKNDDVIISKAILQKKVLKKELCLFDRNLDMHISNIRRKMSKGGLSKQHIKTVHGKGYIFSERFI